MDDLRRGQQGGRRGDRQPGDRKHSAPSTHGARESPDDVTTRERRAASPLALSDQQSVDDEGSDDESPSPNVTRSPVARSPARDQTPPPRGRSSKDMKIANAIVEGLCDGKKPKMVRDSSTHSLPSSIHQDSPMPKGALRSPRTKGRSRTPNRRVSFSRTTTFVVEVANSESRSASNSPEPRKADSPCRSESRSSKADSSCKASPSTAPECVQSPRGEPESEPAEVAEKSTRAAHVPDDVPANTGFSLWPFSRTVAQPEPAAQEASRGSTEAHGVQASLRSGAGFRIFLGEMFDGWT